MKHVKDGSGSATTKELAAYWRMLSVSNCFLRRPGQTVCGLFEDRIHDCDRFARDSRDDDFVRFAGCTQAVSEGYHHNRRANIQHNRQYPRES